MRAAAPSAQSPNEASERERRRREASSRSEGAGMRCGWGWAEDRGCRPEPERSTAAPGPRHDGGRCGPTPLRQIRPRGTSLAAARSRPVHGWWISGSGTRSGTDPFKPNLLCDCAAPGESNLAQRLDPHQADRMSSATIPVSDTVLLFEIIWISVGDVSAPIRLTPSVRDNCRVTDDHLRVRKPRRKGLSAFGVLNDQSLADGLCHSGASPQFEDRRRIAFLVRWHIRIGPRLFSAMRWYHVAGELARLE